MNPGIFLYFVPDIAVEGITRDWLRASPLADVFRDVWLTGSSFAKLTCTRGVVHGPEGQEGVLLGANLPDGQQFGYYPAAQEWRLIDGVWCGYERERKPTAESLQRSRVFPGYEVELQDGRAWIAPIIRPWHEASESFGCNLPMVVGLAEDSSERTCLVQDRFREWWDLSGRLADYWTGKVGMNLIQQHEAAIKVMSLNYRIGPREVDWLQLFDSQADETICMAAIDGPELDEFVRRKREGTAADPT